MRLKEDQIRALFRAWATKEMIEPNLENLSGRGIAGDMAAQFTIGLIGACDHSQRIPTHDGRQAFFDGQIAGKRRLALQRNRVAVRRIRQYRTRDTEFARLSFE